jgi:hypothetical protein
MQRSAPNARHLSAGTDEELSRLLEFLDNWPYDDSAAFKKFALFTGFRRGKLFKLRWSGIDFERGTTADIEIISPPGGSASILLKAAIYTRAMGQTANEPPPIRPVETTPPP